MQDALTWLGSFGEMTQLLWWKVSKLWPMRDSAQSFPHATGKGTRLLGNILPGLDLMPDEDSEFILKWVLACGMEHVALLLAGVNPAGLWPCLLWWEIPANRGSVNWFCQPISNLAYAQSQFLDTMMEPGTSAALHVCNVHSEIPSN